LRATFEALFNVFKSFDGQPNQLSVLLRQGLLTWSGHVMSWVDDADFPVHVMRYEDMLCQPQATFAAAMRFAGLPNDAARLHKALTFSHFALLQAQEYAHGFKEKPATAALFFRQGTMGAWRDVLTNRQMARLIRDHGEVMRRFGYLNDAGEVVC
jgi:aryl sulfotransferase